MSVHSGRVSKNKKSGRLLTAVVRSFTSRYSRSERGSVAIIFALTASIVFGLVGGAVDYGRWLSARNKTLNAMDAAVLAAGRVLQLSGKTEAEAIAVAHQYYNRNKSNLLDVDNVTFAIENGSVIVASSASTVVTPFLSIIGVPDLAVNNISKAELAASGNSGTNIEISLMLDITGSMGWNNRLAIMKTAAKDLIDIVIWADQSEYTSRVALVPFSEQVNVGRSYFQAVTNQSVSGSGTSRTCIRERNNSNRYNDRKPNSTNGFFDYYGGSYTCRPTISLMPLSSDKAALKSHVDTFIAKGGTAGHLGTAWAWYALSPKWGNVWGYAKKGKPYSWINEVSAEGQQKLQKIAVLMTDGEYNTQYSGDSSATQARKICTKMKAKGIVVYTVGFELNSGGAAVTTLEQCATSSSHFYNATDGNALKSAFRDIALKISTLRLAE